MNSRILRLRFLSAMCLLVVALLGHRLVHAQTIDSRDTRTFQDSRGQDNRQSPSIIPPGEAERLKKLTERATVPEETEPPATSENSENGKRESGTPYSRKPPDKRDDVSR